MQKQLNVWNKLMPIKNGLYEIKYNCTLDFWATMKMISMSRYMRMTLTYILGGTHHLLDSMQMGFHLF